MMGLRQTFLRRQLILSIYPMLQQIYGGGGKIDSSCTMESLLHCERSLGANDGSESHMGNRD